MKSFMEIGPHVFEKSGRQTDTQTDRQTRQLYIYIQKRPCDKSTFSCKIFAKSRVWDKVSEGSALILEISEFLANRM